MLHESFIIFNENLSQSRTEQEENGMTKITTFFVTLLTLFIIAI